jgi:hypothetical protein
MNVDQVRRFALSLVFVADDEREYALAVNPEFLEKLHWGERIVGVRVSLAKAKPKVVTKLLAQAWTRKAPKGLLSTAALPSTADK